MSSPKRTTETPDVRPAPPVYLDCNATTPIEPAVAEVVRTFLEEEIGNAGSRTHEFGTRANQAVRRAREQVAAVVDVSPDEVIFTSGATESNNLAILGLANFGERHSRRHILSTAIEHKAVLEPIEHLRERGFDVELLSPNGGGWIDPTAVRSAVRPDTLLVSVMHANNETGVLQPISDIADTLRDSDAFFHIDAAQGFGKEIRQLRHTRIDLISLSGHKIYAPKGIGALIARRRRYDRPPLAPLMYGGGQERGLRPGTLPVPLVVGFGHAAELALAENEARERVCREVRTQALDALASLQPTFNGDQQRVLPHVINLSVPGVDSEASIIALKGLVAVSNGSACTSQSYQPSHVLTAMGLTPETVRGALRLSWCHLTGPVPWADVAACLRHLIVSPQR